MCDMDKSIHVLHDLTQENTRASIHILQDLTRETYMSFYQNLSHEDTHMSHTHVTHTCHTHTRVWANYTTLRKKTHTSNTYYTSWRRKTHTSITYYWTSGTKTQEGYILQDLAQEGTRNTYYKISHKTAHACMYEHMGLPAKLLDYFLRSNKSNVNQSYYKNSQNKTHKSNTYYKTPHKKAHASIYSHKTPCNNTHTHVTHSREYADTSNKTHASTYTLQDLTRKHKQQQYILHAKAQSIAIHTMTLATENSSPKIHQI